MTEMLTTTSAARRRARLVCDMVAQTARLMVGVPDYDTYVAHRQTTHPDQPVMTTRILSRASASTLRGRQRPVPRLLLTAMNGAPPHTGVAGHWFR